MSPPQIFLCRTQLLESTLHVSHVMEKLEAKDRTEAATIALQRGIINLG